MADDVTGTIVVEPVPVGVELPNPRKRARTESHDEDEEIDIEGPPSKRVSVEESDTPKSQVERLLNAKHRRKRFGKHVSQEQMKEDLEDVKHFLSLTEEEKQAYLCIYEYDGYDEMKAAGLAKASSLALRVGLAYTVKPDNYDMVCIALDQPEVKDSIATLWDCVDVDQYASVRTIKSISAIGHIGETLLGAGMNLYQGIQKAAQVRKTVLERRQNMGTDTTEARTQSAFDFRHGNTPSAVVQPAQGREPVIVDEEEEPKDDNAISI